MHAAEAPYIGRLAHLAVGGCSRVANFPRTTLPRTPVNKGKKKAVVDLARSSGR